MRRIFIAAVLSLTGGTYYAASAVLTPIETDFVAQEATHSTMRIHLNSRVADLEAENLRLTRAMDVMTIEQINLLQAYDVIETDLSATRSGTAQVDAETARLIKTLNETVFVQNARLDATIQDRDTLREEVRDQTDLIASLETELESNNARTDVQIVHLQGALDERIAALETTQSTIAAQQLELETRAQANVNLARELAESRIRIADAHVLASDQTTQIAALTNALTQSDARTNLAYGEIETLLETVNLHEITINSLIRLNERPSDVAKFIRVLNPTSLSASYE